MPNLFRGVHMPGPVRDVPDELDFEILLGTGLQSPLGTMDSPRETPAQARRRQQFQRVAFGRMLSANFRGKRALGTGH
jgi:hypothetical protein